MKTITESTLIPISLVISMLGGAFFVTYVYFQTNANAKAITEIQAKQDDMSAIKVDIGVIKAKIEGIERAVRRR